MSSDNPGDEEDNEGPITQSLIASILEHLSKLMNQ
jgi:hypothetical protein